jgi:RimJ/RimL family protein N-acetyltransferase
MLRAKRLQARVLSADELAATRRRSWSLKPPVQDYFLEQHVRRSAGFGLRWDAREIGHLILSPERTLLELELQNGAPASSLLRELIPLLRVARAWRLSAENEQEEQDVLQRLLREFFPVTRVLGISFREYRPAALPLAALQARQASSEDLQALLAIIDPEIHATAEALGEDLNQERIFLYERNGHALGMGVVSRILPDLPEHDIGLLVAPPFRGQGFGSAIVQHLAALCLGRGWRPVCSCDTGNHASRRCLEKAGFIETGHVLELS